MGKQAELGPTKSRELQNSTSRDLSLKKTKSGEYMAAAKAQHGETHKVPRESTWHSWFGQRKEALAAFEEEAKAKMKKASGKASS